MSKKPNWITIPEHANQNLAVDSGKSKKAASAGIDFVKNKWFWGIGFAVVLVAAFAVLAPGQFSSLLKGSLFDTTGLTEEQTSGIINPGSLLVPQEKTAETPAATPETPAATETQPVVQPITRPEEIQVTPLQTEPEDCKADLACLLTHMKDCSRAKATMAYAVQIQDFEAAVEITGADADNCSLKVAVTKAPQADLVGKEAVCTLAKGDITEDAFKGNFTDSATFAQVCTGDLVTALKAYLDNLSAAAAQAKLVEELQKQVQNLQQQKEQATQTVQQIVEQAEQVKPAAPNVQPAQTVSQSGFKTNPNRVTVTPEEMLRRNAAAGTQYAPQTSIVSTYQQPTPVSAAKTPQTGPAEIIALMGLFAALVGWRFIKLFSV